MAIFNRQVLDIWRSRHFTEDEIDEPEPAPVAEKDVEAPKEAERATAARAAPPPSSGDQEALKPSPPPAWLQDITTLIRHEIDCGRGAFVRFPGLDKAAWIEDLKPLGSVLGIRSIEGTTYFIASPENVIFMGCRPADGKDTETATERAN